MSITDRAVARTPSRRALTTAGIATIAFSLIVSIGPALAAPGNGNSGTVKIHDASTSLEAGSVANEPWVCQFFVGFYSEDNEAGSWQIVSWPPTGDGSVAASGAYATSGDGADATAVLSLANGHYRLQWTPDGANEKHKTFWVACEESPASDEATPPSEDPAPTDESTPPSDDAAPTDESTPPSDDAAPSDEAAPPSDDAAPSDEQPPADEETPPSDEETPPSDEQPPADEETPPSDEETPPSDEETGEGGASSEDEPPSNEEQPPADQDEASDPSDDASDPGDEAPAENGDPDPAQQPEGQVKGSNSHDGSQGSVDARQSNGGTTAMPDTSTVDIGLNTGPGGALAAIGILLIVLAHAGTRRERHLPTA